MQNVVINMCEKFHYNDRSKNDRALGYRKSDNNKKNNNEKNVRSAWRSVSGSKNVSHCSPLSITYGHKWAHCDDNRISTLYVGVLV